MRANGHGCSRIREFSALRASTLRWVQADTQTLTRLFQFPVRYVIPLYQRPYVWSEERQWAPLWKDIAAVADRFRLLGAADTKPPSHFLGAIVVEQQHSPPGAPPQFLVTDKRQRLTTLQLLFRGRPERGDDGLPCLPGAVHPKRSPSELSDFAARRDTRRQQRPISRPAAHITQRGTEGENRDSDA